MLGFLKRRRRRKLKRQSFPTEWQTIVEHTCPHWAGLSASEKIELQGHVQVFLAEKNFEGCGGVEITDEMRVTIAATACLLLLGRKTDYFPRMMSVLVYPTEFVSEIRQVEPGGIVTETEQERLGESWYRGPVVLAWDSVQRGAANARDGRNVVLHEFAHQLDSEDGAVNGAPVLDARAAQAAWANVLGAEYTDLIRRIAADDHSDLRDYAATNPAEFFAVVTEHFFEQPRRLNQRHPELYEQFKTFYRQDPAARIAGDELA
jgi:MtfA peptidase